MHTITAFDAKNRFGQLLDAARRGPVTVTKKGRPAAVVLSIEDFDRLRGSARGRLEASIKALQDQAMANGLTEEKLDELLADES